MLGFQVRVGQRRSLFKTLKVEAMVDREYVFRYGSGEKQRSSLVFALNPVLILDC